MGEPFVHPSICEPLPAYVDELVPAEHSLTLTFHTNVSQSTFHNYTGNLHREKIKEVTAYSTNLWTREHGSPENGSSRFEFAYELLSPCSRWR